MISGQLVLLLVLLSSSVCFAQARPSLGTGNARVRALLEKRDAKQTLTASEQRFWQRYRKAADEYERVDAQTWPFCGVGFASDGGPDCNTLDVKELAKAPFLEKDEKSGQTFRFRSSASQRANAAARLAALEKAWE